MRVEEGRREEGELTFLVVFGSREPVLRDEKEKGKGRAKTTTRQKPEALLSFPFSLFLDRFNLDNAELTTTEFTIEQIVPSHNALVDCSAAESWEGGLASRAASRLFWTARMKAAVTEREGRGTAE